MAQIEEVQHFLKSRNLPIVAPDSVINMIVEYHIERMYAHVNTPQEQKQDQKVWAESLTSRRNVIKDFYQTSFLLSISEILETIKTEADFDRNVLVFYEAMRAYIETTFPPRNSTSACVLPPQKSLLNRSFRRLLKWRLFGQIEKIQDGIVSATGLAQIPFGAIVSFSKPPHTAKKRQSKKKKNPNN